MKTSCDLVDVSRTACVAGLARSLRFSSLIFCSEKSLQIVSRNIVWATNTHTLLLWSVTSIFNIQTPASGRVPEESYLAHSSHGVILHIHIYVVLHIHESLYFMNITGFMFCILAVSNPIWYFLSGSNKATVMAGLMSSRVSSEASFLVDFEICLGWVSCLKVQASDSSQATWNSPL